MFKTIDLSKLELVQVQQYLQAAVAPRPIALASTVDIDGNVNLSPFSFFNLFSTNPPVLIFAPNRRLRDGTNKHTYFNAKNTHEVVINIVDFSMAEQMSLSSCEYPSGVNEFVKAGFTQLASDVIKPPRVKEAKVSFECSVLQVIELGEDSGAGNLILCKVLKMHIAEEILNEQGFIDPLKTDWIARSGGDWYVRANQESMFLLPKPNVKTGVGVDAIPEQIRILNFFTGNELGRLGNVDVIPTDKEVNEFAISCKGDYLTQARKHLKKGDGYSAWKAILASLKL
jgi:flavin reductase (DIM6/NTAB) family NADH-FMN oxidoreductase RutF